MSLLLLLLPMKSVPAYPNLNIQCTVYAQAAKAYENHVAENGQPDNHAQAKEIL
jgi:hypothetical protein